MSVQVKFVFGLREYYETYFYPRISYNLLLFYFNMFFHQFIRTQAGNNRVFRTQVVCVRCVMFKSYIASMTFVASEVTKKQEAYRPDSSAIYNWLSDHIKFTQSEIRSSRSRFEHYSKSLI